jgi:hypothetical protein
MVLQVRIHPKYEMICIFMQMKQIHMNITTQSFFLVEQDHIQVPSNEKIVPDADGPLD